jgi:CheY-like chemotaxis protein
MTKATPPARARGPAEILVVEDNALAADALRLLLETLGHQVRVAGTAAAMVRACAERPVDLMLLDVTLPDGSGLDGLLAAAAEGTAPRITVALTGHEDRAVRERCHKAGCHAVLLKPIQPRDLLRRVAEWLQ